ncbi:hypothetical protein CKO41_08190 [Thiococcus pfennigii]|nr:hypothetical protein [Thiococcus pfennigii]
MTNRLRVRIVAIDLNSAGFFAMNDQPNRPLRINRIRERSCITDYHPTGAIRSQQWAAREQVSIDCTEVHGAGLSGKRLIRAFFRWFLVLSVAFGAAAD